MTCIVSAGSDCDQWAIGVCKAVGANSARGSNAYNLLTDWAQVARSEAGYNPIKAQWNVSGSSNWNGSVIQNYPSVAAGITGTAQQIMNTNNAFQIALTTVPNFPNILGILREGVDAQAWSCYAPFVQEISNWQTTPGFVTWCESTCAAYRTAAATAAAEQTAAAAAAAALAKSVAAAAAAAAAGSTTTAGPTQSGTSTSPSNWAALGNTTVTQPPSTKTALTTSTAAGSEVVPIVCVLGAAALFVGAIHRSGKGRHKKHPE